MTPHAHPFSLKVPVVAFLVFAMLGFDSVQAADNTEQWTAIDIVGSPRYSVEDRQWITMEPGIVLPAGAVVETTDRERVVLLRSGDSMTIYPNSRIRVKPQQGLLTSVMQYLGEVLFQVERIDNRRFEVNTPYMIAGVKGTTFGITVATNAANAYLLDGRLTVTGARSGMHTELTPGLHAQVASSATTIHRSSMPAGLRKQWSSRRNDTQEIRRKLSSLPPVSRAAGDVELGAPVVGLDRSAGQVPQSLPVQRFRPDSDNAMEHAVDTGRRLNRHQRALDRANNGARESSGSLPDPVPSGSGN